MAPDYTYNSLRAAGYSGAIPDMLESLYRSQGALGTTFPELEMSWLAVKGFTQPTLNERWMAYLRSLGFTGSYTDMYYGAARAGTLFPPASLVDQALLDMYTGGLNGSYLNLTDMAYLRQDITKESAVVTASGQPVGRIIDKSANDNDVWAPNGGGERGTFFDTAGKKDVVFNTPFKANTGGGSGQVADNTGFYFVGLVEPQGYYHVLWSDKVGNTGREIRYDPDSNGFVFDVGTGAGRAYAIVEGIANLYNNPTGPPAGVKWLIQARHEGTNIYLKVDERAEVPGTAATYAPGATDFAIDGYFSAAGGNTGRIALAAHVFSPLTQPKRDAAYAYANTLR